ncbi:MAG TPA: fused MFS/spermidine synthase [Candidatus Bathyarchaeia archaeon]|nr:fused MFS/spermidine synthase [Candidatus Bathyarchaeia archaeon]
MSRRALFILFFVSGACGLVYEVVWMRILSLTLSVTTYAVTTVLCAFMAGLALGAGIAGRLADRLERPLLTYGLTELGVAATGLAAPGILFGLGPAYVWIHAQLGGEGIAFSAARFLLAAALLLLPCTLMGATLPLLVRAVIGDRGTVGLGAGALYAANTLGAVAGCIAAGFAMIPALGLRATSAVAACLNAGVGLAAIWLDRNPARVARHAGGEPSLAAGAQPDRPTIGSVPIVVPAAASSAALLGALAFGASGFTALGYEVLWTRALQQFTHNSTYAYTGMLAMFLLGIGAGSAGGARLADRLRAPLVAIGVLEIGVGMSVIVSLVLYTRLLDWIPAATSALGGLGSWPRALALIFSVAGVILLPTTLLFGAIFPFVARAVVESMHALGRRIAVAYTINTLGSIFGALLVGFLFLPVTGMRTSFVVLIAINLAVGAVVVTYAARRALAVAAAAVAIAGLSLAVVGLPSDLFKQVFLARYGKLLLYREQVTDTVMVTENPRGQRMIRYADGRGTAGTSTVSEDRSYTHIAMLLHPEPRRVLNICFGVGNSLASVVQYPIERVDCVELSPGVVYAAPFFRSTNRDVLSDPRVHLTIADGRNYLLVSPDRYDVIRLDPPELHTAGVVNLYTREFFELAREHLAPGGIFSIWVNIVYTPEADVKTILRTVSAVFPYVSVWHGPYLYSWVINGSLVARPPDMALLERHFAEPAVKADLASIGIRDPIAFLNDFVMAGDEVTAYAGDASVITDDRTRLDFTVPRSVESFFGISNSTVDNWLVNQIDPQLDLVGRAVKMCRYKQPVLPHVVNLEASGLDLADVRARLDTLAASLPAGCGKLVRTGDANARR